MITVAITGCVALFADGEGREAIASELAARQQKNQVLIAEAEKVGKRTVGFDRTSAGKGAVAAANDSVDWSDNGGDFGAPMEDPGGSSPGGDDGPALGGGGGMFGRFGPGPMSVMPPMARQQNAQGAAARAQFEKMLRDSRQRTGAPE